MSKLLPVRSSHARQSIKPLNNSILHEIEFKVRRDAWSRGAANTTLIQFSPLWAITTSGHYDDDDHDDGHPKIIKFRLTTPADSLIPSHRMAID